MTDHILNDLYQTISSRKGQSADTSYTASLFAAGREKIARKVMEEATETIIESLKGDAEKLASESADLLYHLLVLWAEAGVTPDSVMDILQKRQGTSGISEKASRLR